MIKFTRNFAVKSSVFYSQYLVVRQLNPVTEKNEIM